MLFCNIDYLTGEYNIEHGYVGVQAEQITYIGAAEPSDEASYGERYDGAGKLLVPGLFNIHAHAPMTLLRGYAESMVLQDWLQQKVFPFEAKLTSELAYTGTMLAIAEMLRFGVVSFSDMYFFTDARAQAVAESGIKANLCAGLMYFDQEKHYSGSDDYAENLRQVKDYHGAEGGRLRIDLNIHSEYISNPFQVREVGEHAKELGVGVQVHVSETASEHEACKQRHQGMTPAAYFAGMGLFDVPVTAAHCVWSEPDDWQLFRHYGVTVAANPASNLKLASGFAPVPEMALAGVRVGLGTDGVASNNNHNMYKDIYLLATLYKAASADATAVTPAQAFRAASLHGAQAQGREDTGTIEIGKRADLAVHDINVPWMKPVTNSLSNLVFAGQGSDVVLTMVDGRVLYRDNTWPTIDVEKIMASAQTARDRIVSELAED